MERSTEERIHAAQMEDKHEEFMAQYRGQNPKKERPMEAKSITVVGQAVMPAMMANEARERYKQLHDFIASQMKEGTDYGSIPGMEDRKDPKTGEVLPAKKVLLKPGAEKLSTLFALRPSFSDVGFVEDWTGKDHNGEPFFYYRVKASLWRGGEMICDADGSCNSMEKKYRYRQQNRKCPTCGKESIIKGKQEYGGGWLCWKQRGGCGAKFFDGEAIIEDQQTGQIPNPDIADQANTILKMAQKRALIAAILIAANASDYFTQDIEEDEPQSKVVEVKAEVKPEVKPEVKSEVNASVKPEPPTTRPLAPEKLRHFIGAKAEAYAKEGVPCDEKFRNVIVGYTEIIWEREPSKDREAKRHTLYEYLTGKASAKEMTSAELLSIRDWLKWTVDSGGLVTVDPMSVKEANAVLVQAAKDKGQQSIPA